MPNYIVKQGDCISSIAQRYGFFWEKVWNHPNNAQLKAKRKNPNILYPGDVVFVPAKEGKEICCVTEQRHQFRKKGVLSNLQIQLLDEEEEPRANVEYVININGQFHRGLTTADGWIRRSIPSDAKRGELIVIEGDIQEEYQLNLGYLDPVDQDIGVQQRLNNLGFDCGEPDGKIGQRTQEALKEFQRKYNLIESGRADQATRAKLKEVYGC